MRGCGIGARLTRRPKPASGCCFISARSIGNAPWPRGKQVLKPHGIMYTAVTGIWQTVWLEPVPASHIKSLKVVPDVDRKRVSVTVNSNIAGRVQVLAQVIGSKGQQQLELLR